MFLQLALSPISFDQFNNLSIDAMVFNFIKILFLIGFFLYILFAFLAVRQIEEMRRTVITPLSSVIQLVGYLHLLLAVLVFIFAYTFLK
jgi:hypothetical protein